MSDELLSSGDVSVSVLFGTVSINIECSDDYEAQTLFDDLVARLQRGEKVTLGGGRAPPGDEP